MEWIRENIWITVAVIGGVVVSVLASEHHSWKEASARVASGLFFSIVFPSPVLEILGRDPEVYGNAVAGLLAMTGYALARLLVNADKEWLAALLGSLFGRRK